MHETAKDRAIAILNSNLAGEHKNIEDQMKNIYQKIENLFQN